MSGMARARISALEEALKWAQDRLRFYASYSEKPDSPFWNDWRHTEAVLEGRDPDKDEPAEKVKDKARELLANMKEIKGVE